MSCMRRPVARLHESNADPDDGDRGEAEALESDIASFSPLFWVMVRFWLVILIAVATLIWHQHSQRGNPMSNPEQPAEKTAVQSTTQGALDAFGAQLLKFHEQFDGNGQARIALPLVQMFLDLAVAQMKLEAIFEELGTEQLIDPAKLTGRLLQKLERETKQLKLANANKTRLAVAHALVGINGKG